MPRKALARFIEIYRLPEAKRLVIACSGGLDSVVLLHAAVSLSSCYGLSIHVVHVHHGLSPWATEWAGHVRQLSADYQASFSLQQVQVEAGGSLEQAARESRYRAILSELIAGDVVLTAHHRDDQAETVLLRLLRGSGVTGLSGMRPVSELPYSAGQYRLWRPLLNVGRTELVAYAIEHGLTWVNDESNQDTRHARNALRHDVIPVLARHWPQASSILAETAQRMQEADSLLNDLAMLDFDRVVGEGNTLVIPALQTLNEHRQLNVLRYWLLQLDLPSPDRQGLHHIRTEVCLARPDGTPMFRGQGIEVRRYRERLFAMQPLPALDKQEWLIWTDREQALPLPDGRRLSVAFGKGAGLRLKTWRQALSIEVRFRQGGERLQLPGQDYRKALKALFQEAGIPPWMRERWPLVFLDGILAAVPNLWIDSAYAAAGDEASLLIT